MATLKIKKGDTVKVIAGKENAGTLRSVECAVSAASEQ